MPTSLMFVALAAAWLIVLVPMVARRRDEVSHTAESALAARVLRRGGTGPERGRSVAAARRPGSSSTSTRVKEVFPMPHADTEQDDSERYDGEHHADDHGDDHDVDDRHADQHADHQRAEHHRNGERDGEYEADELESAYAVGHARRPSGGSGGRAHEYAEDAEHDDADGFDGFDEQDDSDGFESGRSRGRRAEGRRSRDRRSRGRRSGRRADDHPGDADHPEDAEYAEGAEHGVDTRRGAADARDRDGHGAEDGHDDGTEPSGERSERRAYRPGRGGFDAETAELTARAKYATRQRLVVLLLVAAVGSGLAAGLVLPLIWWGHGAVDLILVGYLTYLRRQVRIEEAVRRRRTARLGAARGRPANRAPARSGSPLPAPRSEPDRAAPAHPDALAEPGTEDDSEYEAEYEGEPGFASTPVDRPPLVPVQYPGATTVELDDEDPAFDELDEPARTGYRRAVGE